MKIVLFSFIFLIWNAKKVYKFYEIDPWVQSYKSILSDVNYIKIVVMSNKCSRWAIRSIYCYIVLVSC